MKDRRWLIVVFVAAAALVFAALSAPVDATGYRAERTRTSLAPSGFQQSGAFTYQGRLVKSGVPVNGTCDASFHLYGAPAGGFIISSVFSPALQVNNGLFLIALDFGQNLFTGEGRWLETEVGCGADTPTVLTPRTALLPAPYAHALPGFRTYAANPDFNGRPTVNVIGGVISDGIGNSIDAESYDSVIGGGDFNAVRNASLYGHIGGGKFNEAKFGSQYAAVGGGYSNRIESAHYGTIGGGDGNQIKSASSDSVIAGGANNLIANDSLYAAIGGGSGNAVDGNSDNANVAGGQLNVITGTSASSAIGGGGSNRLDGSSQATIGGGAGNNIASGDWGTVSGGRTNKIRAADASIGGGRENLVTSTAQYAAIPGGYQAGARDYGQMAFASGGFAGVPGTAQYSVHVLRGTTPANGSQIELFADGAVRRIAVPAQSAMTFFAQVVALTDDQWVGAWEIRGVIKNSGSGALSQGCAFAVCLPTAPVILQLQSLPSGESAVAAADNTNKSLSIKATGNNSHPVRWVATVQVAEVGW